MTLYEKFIKKLEAVNDGSQTEEEHRKKERELYVWKEGVRDACGVHLNGDFHYIDLGIERPMCCGVFLDWESSL